MASIYKRGDKWAYTISVGIHPTTGKRKQKTKSGFKTKKEASQAAADMERSFNFSADESVNFEQLFSEWWEGHKSKLKPSTIYMYEFQFKNHILPYFAKLKVNAITRRHCQEFVNAIYQKVPGSVKGIRFKASMIFKYAMQEDVIQKNPMDFIVTPKRSEEEILEEQGKRNYWEKEEALYFLENIEDKLSFNDVTLFHVLIFSGIRKGEALALTWDDIDFTENTISITKTYYWRDMKAQIQTVKTRSGRRTFEIDEGTMKRLKKHKIKQKEFFLQFPPVESNDVVFTRPNGRYIRPATVNKILTECSQELDMHQISVHGLRHTHASLQFEAGADMKEVQEILGHSDSKTTYNIYTHVTKAKKKKTAQNFAQYMQAKE